MAFYNIVFIENEYYAKTILLIEQKMMFYLKNIFFIFS